MEANDEGYTTIDLKELSKKYDFVIATPHERAHAVFTHLRATLPEATNWDILCFCAGYIANISAEGAGFDWLRPVSKNLISLVATAHYVHIAPIEYDELLRRPKSDTGPEVEGENNSNKPDTPS